MPRKCGLCKKEGHNRTNCENQYYKGEYNYKGERHGKGTYEYKLKKYRGWWKYGCPIGSRETVGKNGFRLKYEGDWVNGKREGWGKLTYANGDIYEGEWENDRQHGYGILWEQAWESFGVSVKGKFVCKYEGEFKEGNRSGQGVRTGIMSGIRYEGGWKSNQWHGYGVFTAPNGRECLGVWKYGEPFCRSEPPWFTSREKAIEMGFHYNGKCTEAGLRKMVRNII